MRCMSFIYSAQDIAAACTGPASQVAIEVVGETGSTNADLMARVHALPGPTLLLAEKQTAGRGRSGRTWHMEPGKTLTFSLAWKFLLPMAQLPGLSLVAGVAIAETLDAHGVDARLKWPNDVLMDGGKLAGILIEAVAEKEASQPAVWAIIGVGLNLQSSNYLSEQIGMPIAAAAGLSENRNRIVTALLNGLAKALLQFEEEGLQAFTSRWNRLHAYAGKPVAILDGGSVLHQGQAVGIDESGRFVIDTDQGRVAVLSGDVSLRLVESMK
jgi:BirA family transcriptional regulator, biotin operon repressor / biotin---[acetyl-CoA-carboxylase] ligase